MKYLITAIAMLATVASLSCGGGATSTNQTQDQKQSFTSQPQAQQAVANKSIPHEPPPNIPKDAEWTILCATIVGPDHAAQARSARAALIKQTQMRDWYVIHGEGQTTLYYGFYRAINDPNDAKESARAQNDRHAIAGLTDPANGARLFSSVILTKLDAADPTAPAEWDLTRAQGAYSLQIAVFKDSPSRRSTAVEAVREARAQGYEAYFYHGPTSSSVCIGAWPATAVREHNDFNVKNMEKPGAVPLVTAGQIPTLPQGDLMTPDGKPINVVSAKFEVLDPKLRAVMLEFPTHSINGVEQPVLLDPRTGQKRLAPKRSSFLVKIPRAVQFAAPTVAGGNTDTGATVGATSAAPEPQPSQQLPPPPVRPSTAAQGGKLKSLEDR
jgi:hypothetical protein